VSNGRLRNQTTVTLRTSPVMQLVLKILTQIDDSTEVLESAISLLHCFNLRVKYVIVEIFCTMYVCWPTERAVECLFYC